MEHLKKLRKLRGLLQKDLAALLGIERTTYVRYETGASEPPFETLKKLADYFDVSTDYLLDRSDSPYSASIFQQLTGIDAALWFELKELSVPEKQEILDFIKFKKLQKN